MAERVATLRSFAKINLDLRVLYRRRDRYHELRTIFQSISLADTIRVSFTPARRTRVSLAGNVEISNNLILRAAEAVFDCARLTGEVAFELDKRIPMGAGLGGGSSNAAAVLMGLPVLAGATIPFGTLLRLGAELGSDVPYFLYGGTALGIGRGEELYPLADVPASRGVLIAPGVHVSTAGAYEDLKRGDRNQTLTSTAPDTDTESFRSLVWAMSAARPPEDWKALCANDFEGAVFGRYPALGSVKTKLRKLGARPALMTGSGSAVFGLFESRDQVESAFQAFSKQNSEDSRVYRMVLLTRRRYRSWWRRQLAGHITADTQWPPRSRYSKR